jgi:hypothetical protein
MRSFLSSLLVVVGKDLKLTRNRSDGQSRRDLNVAARPEAPFQRRMNIA